MHGRITWNLSLSTLVPWKHIRWLGRSRLPKNVSFRQEKYHVAWLLQGWRHCNKRSSHVRKHWCEINISQNNGKLGTFLKALLSQCRIIYYDNFPESQGLPSLLIYIKLLILASRTYLLSYIPETKKLIFYTYCCLQTRGLGM